MAVHAFAALAASFLLGRSPPLTTHTLVTSHHHMVSPWHRLREVRVVAGLVPVDEGNDHYSTCSCPIASTLSSPLLEAVTTFSRSHLRTRTRSRELLFPTSSVDCICFLLLPNVLLWSLRRCTLYLVQYSVQESSRRLNTMLLLCLDLLPPPLSTFCLIFSQLPLHNCATKNG